MDKLRTLNLPPHGGRDFFATIFVEHDPDESTEATSKSLGSTQNTVNHTSTVCTNPISEKTGSVRVTRMKTLDETYCRIGGNTPICSFRTTTATNADGQLL